MCVCVSSGVFFFFFAQKGSLYFGKIAHEMNDVNVDNDADGDSCN